MDDINAIRNAEGFTMAYLINCIRDDMKEYAIEADVAIEGLAEGHQLGNKQVAELRKHFGVPGC